MDKQIGDEQALLRVAEAARVLAISRAKTYAMLASGQLPCVRLGGSVRVPRRALDEWIEARTVRA